MPSRYALAPLLILLAGSGCAALIYEIVWFQLLQLVIGSSAVSLGLLLAFYMGGLCLGSAAFSRLVSTRFDPRRVYAALEAGIGAFGICALAGVPLIGRLYVAGPSAGPAELVFRGTAAGLCLVPPTLLMGCTFPAASRMLDAVTVPARRSKLRGVSRLGLLYSANILGAVGGCVLAGFYLLRVHDPGVATYTAAAANFAVALAAFWLPAGGVPDGSASESAPPVRVRGAAWIYVSIALSGLAALGAEVVWARLLSLLLGATVYTFSIILAVFLVGLWAGSGGGSLLARHFRDPKIGLAVCQMLIAAACVWAAYALARSLPYWPINTTLSLSGRYKWNGPTDRWMNFELDLIRCAWAILPAALLWGASFPLALACAGERTPRESGDPARLTGEVYAANTAGAIVGALLFSLVMIPALGTAGSQRVLIWVAAAGAAAALSPWALMKDGWVRFAAAFTGVAGLAWAASSAVPAVAWETIAYGRRMAPILRDAVRGPAQNQVTPLFVGEGINSSVVIAQRGDQRMIYVGGRPEASSAPVDMRLQRMLGHLPALLHPNPRTVLVVGFGAGVTAGSFVPYPDVQKITICELEPLVPAASGKFFAKENNSVMSDPRTNIAYDDARRYILTTPDKFDIITTDPDRPWVKDASALYSKQYYELVKQHLNPGGVAAQRLPLFESDENTVKTELATFFSVFPGATVWSTYLDGEGYDLVLLGQPEETVIDVDAVDRRLKTPAYARVAQSLAESGWGSAVDLLADYAGRATDLQPTLDGAELNDDWSMRLQYMAGMGLNSIKAASMYHEVLSYRKFPEGLLTGTGERIEKLRELLGRPALTF